MGNKKGLVLGIEHQKNKGIEETVVVTESEQLTEVLSRLDNIETLLLSLTKKENK